MSVPVFNRDTKSPMLDNIQSLLFNGPSAIPIGVQLHGMDGQKGDKGDKGDRGDRGDKGDKGDVVVADEQENIALGTVVQGTQNIAIGVHAGSTTVGKNNILLGHGAKASIPTISNEIVLGNSSTSALRCQQTAIAGLSDERDKTNITELDTMESLLFINELRPVQFQWDQREWYKYGVSDKSKAGDMDIGFIAQDILRCTTKDSYRIVTTKNPYRYEVAPGRLIPLLVSSLQELSKRVDELEAIIKK